MLEPQFRWEAHGRQVQTAVSPDGDVADVFPPMAPWRADAWAWTAVGVGYGPFNRSARRDGTAPTERAAKQAAEGALLGFWRARRR